MPQLHYHYLDYRQDELAEVFPENCFDYIVAEECFVGVKDTEKLTDKLWPLLKETGCFLTSCYNARYVDLIQQEAAGNFGAYARGIFTREEIWQKCTSRKSFRKFRTNLPPCRTGL